MTDTIVRKYERHGKRHTAEYTAWCHLKERCLNPKICNYNDYGGRGITVSPEWEASFARFYEDMGDRPSPDYSVDRIDNSKGYSKDNCQWSNRYQQAQNQRIAKNNKTGIRGVSWCKSKQKYIARIHAEGKAIHIGIYEKLEDAAQARQQAETQYFQQVS